MSQPQLDGRIDQDPLLDFSIEAGSAQRPQPSPADPQPVAAPSVPNELDTLRERVEHLEKALQQSTKHVDALKSEVATLVGAKKDIRRQVTNDRALRLISSTAGIVLGIVAGAWFWMSTANEPAVQATPVVVAGTIPNLPVPKPTTTAPAAIVPAAAVSPARPAPSQPAAPQTAAPQPSPPQPAPRRVAYVGTLTIDSDPSGRVIIDGKASGTTPLRAENLKAGSHLIWIERDGFHRFTRVVQVPADRITRLVADLEPIAPR